MVALDIVDERLSNLQFLEGVQKFQEFAIGVYLDVLDFGLHARIVLSDLHLATIMWTA